MTFQVVGNDGLINLADDPRAVTALILTYGQPETLRMVLEAVVNQTTPVGQIVVIDNAGEPPAEAVVRSVDSEIDLIRTGRNEGPAGGWSVGLQRFLSTGSGEWVWMLDDDAVPSSTALRELLATGLSRRAPVIRPLVLDHDTGQHRKHPSWCGPLIRRDVIETCGTPMAELVWWAEDTEYFQVRLPGAGFREVLCDNAMVTHHGLRRRTPRSDAQIYYELRNRLWIRIYAKGQLRKPTKWWKIVGAVVVALVQVGRLEDRRAGIGAAAAGLWDGLRGRLGYRFPLEARDPNRRSAI